MVIAGPLAPAIRLPYYSGAEMWTFYRHDISEVFQGRLSA
jgi:hypothetical protein